ncbi:MAG: selenide, water dikinase SelD [Bacteroidota bacterium]
MASTIKLTEHVKGGGCGCKIAPEILHQIVSTLPNGLSKELLVNQGSKDDAAVIALNDSECLISTTDFFLPVVDNPYDFGRIAAANALSDVYAMGGRPILALAILGWPVDLLPIEAASEVMKGASDICRQAGVFIAGGHSISTSEPLFGLSVNGLVNKEHLKENHTCQPGNYLYITKPLGIGLLANAMKHKELSEDGYQQLIQHTTQLNTLGAELGKLSWITAMTDITGFGLLGHLSEMLGKDKGAILYNDKIPVIPEARQLAEKFKYPNITTNNYNFVKDRCEGLNGLEFLWLCDPQTSGGLMFTSTSEMAMDHCICIGRITDTGIISLQ